MSSTSPFLALPGEIRRMIVEEAIGSLSFHFFEDGRRMCSQNHADPFCNGPEQCHEHREPSTISCTNCLSWQPPGLMLTCRALYREGLPILVGNARLLFPSSQIFLRTIDRSHGGKISLARLRHVQLCGGPAKPANKETNEALSLLADRATTLRSLSLVFEYYWRMFADPIVLASETICIIGRMRGLQRLQLSLGEFPLGPVDSDDLDEQTRQKIQLRLRTLGEVIQERHSQQGPLDSRQYYAEIVSAMAAILNRRLQIAEQT